MRYLAAGDEVAPQVHFLGHFGVASLAGLKAWQADGAPGGLDPTWGLIPEK